MKQDLLKKQFTALNNSGIGTPEAGWKKEFRSTLMMQIKNTVDLEPRALSFNERLREIINFIFPGEELRLATRAVSIMLLVLGVVFGGSITTVSASLNSVPGDLLYPLKRMTEEAQVALASGQDVKAELHVEFAGRRVQEVAKINEASKVDSAERIAAAVEGFKQEIETANEYLNNLNSEPEKVVAVAKIIDAKSEVHQQILNDVSKKVIDSETLGMVQEAQAVAEDASVKAVEVLVVSHTTASSTISTQELKDTVENKINDIERRVEVLQEVAAATSTPVTTQAKSAIGEARELSSAGDFASALNKIKESTELVRAVAAITVTVSSSTTAGTTAVENTSNTQPTLVEAQGSAQINTSTSFQAQWFEEKVIDDPSSTPKMIFEP